MKVAILAAAAPSKQALGNGLTALADAGATVDLIMLNLPVGGLGEVPYRSARRLLPVRYPGGEPLPRWTPGWILNGLRYRLLVLRLRTASPSVRAAMLLARNHEGVKTLDEADVVIALDRWAVYPAWLVARRRGVPTFHGLTAGIEHVRRLAVTPGMAGLPGRERPAARVAPAPVAPVPVAPAPVAPAAHE